MRQRTCTKREVSALTRVALLSKSCANVSNPARSNWARAACARQPMCGNSVKHQPCKVASVCIASVVVISAAGCGF
eukprot:1779909-Alexandrium_andersonii.AAC.1